MCVNNLLKVVYLAVERPGAELATWGAAGQRHAVKMRTYFFGPAARILASCSGG